MLLIFAIVVVILTCATSVLVAVLSSKTSAKALETLDSLHSRQSEQLDKTLDRLMTIRWEDLIALQSVSESEEGGFIPPQDEDEGDDEEEKSRWGHLARLRKPGMELTKDERALLDEDFPAAEEG
jgi:hypothetical protein